MDEMPTEQPPTISPETPVWSLDGDIKERMGRHNGLFSKSYQVARAMYDARIRSWKITPSDHSFITEDSNGKIEEVYYDRMIANCGCADFVENQAYSCMHIEAVRLALAKENVRPKRAPAIRYIDDNYEVSTYGKDGFYETPAVNALSEFNKRRAFTPYEPGTEDFDVFRDYGITLYDFQLSSIRRMLKNKRTVLCLKMGTGKTLCALACTKILARKNIMIVAPKSLMQQWRREINRFNLGSSLLIEKGSDINKYTDQEYLIVSYEMLNHHPELIEDNGFDVAILDEIQKIKNQDSKTWASIRKVKTEFIFSLSGTPIQNSLSDLISIINVLNPVELSPKWKFYHDYCLFSQAKLFGLNMNKLEALRNKFGRYIINPKIDYEQFKIPAKQYEEISCALNDDQCRIHNGCMESARPLLAKSIHTPLTFGEKARLNSLLTTARTASVDARLLQKADDTIKYQKSARFTAIEEKIKEIVLAGGHKLVIYSEWIKTLELLVPALQEAGIGFVRFNGEISGKARDKNLQKFIADPEIKILLSTDSGGVGVDGLQFAANHIVHIEKVWNPAKIDQRNGRLIRALQPCDNVYVFQYTSDCEVEHMINAASLRKNEIVKSVFS